MANLKEQKVYLSVGVVFLLLTGLHYLGWLKVIENLIQKSAIPFLGKMHGLSIKVDNDFEFFKDRQAFYRAYESCVIEKENHDVLEEKVKLLSDENDELKKQLNFIQKSETQHILANVVGKEVLSTDQTFIIDRGSNDGIKVDQPVIVGEGILIGKITKVDENISIIRLLNDNRSRIGASIINQNKSIGVVEGGFGISLKMNLIPRDEIVLVGDKVITSGLEMSIPRGLFIGTVAVVENEPYKPFQQAILTPGTDLGKITIVTVLLTK